MFTMKGYLFLIFCLFLFLIGCKSKSSMCGCPQRAYCEDQEIFEKQFHLEDLTLASYLSVDSARFDFSDILPELSIKLSDIREYIETSYSPLYVDVIKKAFGYEGVRYRRGGTSTNGMDCSGLVYTCFSAYNISLPRSSADMAKYVSDVSREEVKAGDLIFFKTRGRKSINHVGLVIEADNREIKFIHASIRYGVIVSSTLEPYYASTYAKVGRVLSV